MCLAVALNHFLSDSLKSYVFLLFKLFKLSNINIELYRINASNEIVIIEHLLRIITCL